MQLGAINNPRNKLIDEIEWIAGNGFNFIDLLLAAPNAAVESLSLIHI